MKKNKNLILLLFICSIPFFMQFEKDTNKVRITLSSLASNNNIFIGTAVSSKYINTDEKYKNIIDDEFNIITTENEMKFDLIHPERERYNFLQSDALVNFGIEHNKKIRGHTLVWHRRIPEWLEKGQFSKAEMKSILKKHIQTIVGRYKGEIYAWDVVNEAFNEDGTLKDSIWLRTIGKEYIALSYKWAHEADPNALLYYNDFNIEEINAKSDAVYGLFQYFKRNNIPIDGLGMQMHTSIADPYNLEKVKNNIARMGKLNLDVQITELDISLGRYKKNSKVLGKLLNEQSAHYSDILNVCLATSTCTGFIMWGFTDKYTARKENEFPLILDNEYKPKPAYWSLFNTLEDY
ncbi:endo-1,4-beta-xylanase [Paenibacillus alvei]